MIDQNTRVQHFEKLVVKDRNKGDGTLYIRGGQLDTMKGFKEAYCIGKLSSNSPEIRLLLIKIPSNHDWRVVGLPDHIHDIVDWKNKPLELLDNTLTGIGYWENNAKSYVEQKKYKK